MRIRIRHRTVYAYDHPIVYAIQTVRMTPQPHDSLSVIHWSLRGESRKPLPQVIDGYGNIVHNHTVNRPHSEAEILVEGEVETRDAQGVVRGAPELLPLNFYLRETPLTVADEELEAMARDSVGNLAALDALHALMGTVRDRVDYRPGETDAMTTAAEALTSGQGVCQDHAHVFISAARRLGYPARYVGGYLWAGEQASAYEAGHAWAEAYVADLGWVGFDPANRICPAESHVRVAIGLDYWSAAPVRGLWRGEGTENLAVEVEVTQMQGAQQQ